MKLNIMSSNIRFDNPEDGQHCWSGRRNLLSQKIVDFRPHLLGTQEGRRPQLQDLEALVGLKILDTHRDWILERMYPSLFFHPDLHPLENGDIWLSQTPHISGSKSFGSVFPRLATWGKFKFHHKQLMMANLHLDHENCETRLEQTKVFVREIKRRENHGPFVLSGDFNEGPGGPVYEWIIKELNLLDPWKVLGYPEQSSYHKFDGDTQKGKRIDWILISPHFKIHDVSFDTKGCEGVFPSDHFPLFLSLELNSYQGSVRA